MTTWFGKAVARGKRPLKVNVFEHMMAHQGMLEQLPLFPYLGPGDIVPTGALSLTLPETPRVHFYHYNDIPEVILCMASEGGLIATGQVHRGDVLEEPEHPGLPLNSTSTTSRSRFSSIGASLLATVPSRARACARAQTPGHWTGPSSDGTPRTSGESTPLSTSPA